LKEIHKKQIMKNIKHFTKTLAATIFVLLGLLNFIACSSLESSIVGKWKGIDKHETMEFLDDGTFIVGDKDMNVGGKYIVVDKNRIKVELAGLGALMGPVILKVEISGDELSVTEPGNKVAKYQRVDE
jgi:hypothetical protein